MSLDSVTEYALSFSGDAVHLQQREIAGSAAFRERLPAWRHLGSVDFDDPGFRDALIALRVMATGKDASSELPVTLVIPDDQILYTTLTVAPSADREHAVGRALDGLTPYAIGDLAFDWDGDGDSVRVAAVARQTLREASDFAAQYGFTGVSFCAGPESGQYPGAPVFVLDPPQRKRAVVDPAMASVTAAELMIKDEPEARDFAPPARNIAADIDLPAEEPGATAPQAAMPEPVQTIAEPDAAPAPAPTVDPAPELASDALTDIGTVAEASAPESALEKPTEPAPQAEAAAPISPAVEAPAAAPVQPARKAPPVVRHAPTLPREPQVTAPAQQPPVAEPVAAETAAPAMNPRARAVHDRAAEARQSRQPGAAPSAPSRPTPGHRGGLASLIAMLGALVVGLVLIWAFIVPDGEPAQVVASVEPTPVVQAPAPVEQVTPEAVPAPEVAAAPEVTEPEAPIENAAAPLEAAPVAAVPDLSSRRALTEDEARRVIIAAAAVAAAVVPPPQTALAVPAAQVPAPAVAATLPVAPKASPAPAQPKAQAPVAAKPAPTRSPTPQRQVAATPRSAPAAVAKAAPATREPQLTSSARPQLAPRRSTPQTSVPRADTAPKVPSNPIPYAAASQPASVPSRSARPPSRIRAVAQPEAVQPVRAESQPQTPARARPPQRPEGSVPELIQDEGAALDAGEQDQLGALIRDLQRHGLAQTAQPSDDLHAQLAEARPVRKPAKAATASDAVSADAVQEALRSATSAPPDRPATSTEAAAVPARDSGGLLRGSARPSSRPAQVTPGAAAAVPAAAVEKAIASAVNASTATPGGVQLSALSSSPVPPRRSEPAPAKPEAAEAPTIASPAASPAAAAVVAAAPGPNEAEIAARRALDEQLQSQAEARIRARAAADSAAEAQARAAAEARARAQAAAEERAARASKKAYKPPEIDDEPEVAGSAAGGGATTATVAKAATETRSIDLGRTTIIGIIGAGQASRALIRLRNGKIVTVRLGDRIDGGTINSIGDGRLTYVKAGKVRELRLLDGR